MTACRVLLVEKSGALSSRLRTAFNAEVSYDGPAVTAAGLLDRLRARRPNVVVIEISDTLAEVKKVIEAVMAEAPVPIVLVADEHHRSFAFPLLATGALDVIALPSTVDDAWADAFRKQLLLLASVKVVRHPKGRRKKPSTKFAAVKPSYPLVAIASSLGGPRALAELLGGLTPTFGAPIVVCQHITPGFTEGLATWLASETGLRVHEAVDGQRLVKGEVFLAPSDAHLLVQATGLLRVDHGPDEGGFRPSCDVLLRSAAASFGSRAIGVILTGMGRDGAKGLLDIRQRGGTTLAQDQHSCVVFGMPKVAIELGAAEKVLPLSAIAAELLQLVGA